MEDGNYEFRIIVVSHCYGDDWGKLRILFIKWVVISTHWGIFIDLLRLFQKHTPFVYYLWLDFMGTNVIKIVRR